MYRLRVGSNWQTEPEGQVLPPTRDDKDEGRQKRIGDSGEEPGGQAGMEESARFIVEGWSRDWAWKSDCGTETPSYCRKSNA